MNRVTSVNVLKINLWANFLSFTGFILPYKSKQNSKRKEKDSICDTFSCLIIGTPTVVIHFWSNWCILNPIYGTPFLLKYNESNDHTRQTYYRYLIKYCHCSIPDVLEWRYCVTRFSGFKVLQAPVSFGWPDPPLLSRQPYHVCPLKVAKISLYFLALAVQQPR